jgi:hypothetical protein
MGQITPQMKKFLAAIGGPLPSPTREEDRARQACRRRKLAVFDRKLWDWCITDAGTEALRS